MYSVKYILYPTAYQKYVSYYAHKYHLQETLIYSIIRTESRFNPNAQSHVDARGLMQITQETFEWIKSKIAPQESLTFDDLYDPEINIRFGAYFLAFCMQKYEQDISTAAAAYHSGMGKVDDLIQQPAYSENGRTLQSFPYKQMNHYVYKVNLNYKMYERLQRFPWNLL